MQIYLDESGDLGWSFDKPHQNGGSSRYITIAGIVIEQNRLKHLNGFVADLYRQLNYPFGVEKKGSKISNAEASFILDEMTAAFQQWHAFKIISITTAKTNVSEPLKRDKNIFYNFMLSQLLTDVIDKFPIVNIVLDNRTIRLGSRNSFEDCLRAKCWGELGLDTNIVCRYEDSERNRAIWLADWLSNFIWRHYEHDMNDAYLQCISLQSHYSEKTLFMN
jgi:hypothetical protein